MKKKLLSGLATAVVALTAFALTANICASTFAEGEKDPQVEKVKELINELDKETLSGKDDIYVRSIKTLYNSLSGEQQSQIDSTLIDKLDDCIVYVADCVSAEKFTSDFDYLLENPSFAAKNVVKDLTSEYSKFNAQTKGMIKNFTQANKRKALNDAETLLPDIYYDFTSPEINDSTIVNQGVLVGKDATLKGNASTDKGYLYFGNEASSDHSYLQLPNEMFTTGQDFTVAIEYIRTTDTNGVSLFSFGTEAYSKGVDGTNAGFRASIFTGYDRGPTNSMKLATTGGEQEYCGIVHANGDGKNHLMRMIVRYISEAKCLQICTVDTVTDYYMYVNQGCSYPSYNQYTKVSPSNMPFGQFTCNSLGAYDGECSYPAGTTSSFDGKIYSFAFYNRLINEHQLYGVDNRGKYLGSTKMIEIVNNFERPENIDVFERYADAYEDLFSNKTHDDILSIPYDFRYLYDQEKLASYLEAYEIYNDEF